MTRWLVVVSGLLWFSFEVRQSFRHRGDATAHDRGSRVLVQAAAVAGAFCAVFVTRRTPGAVLATVSPVVAWLGLVVFWCGAALRLWCFRTLGRYFTFTVLTTDTQPVIESGPYRLLRHPSYTATLLVLLGLGTFFANGWGLLALTAITWCGLAYRIHVEERALASAMGDRYRAFAAARKRIIPFIW
ncbi:MAG: isoprenylcysteine carboxylmethyltransferase family protein [Hamadaea sp.]|uniref:methyltransferase family protein n=1 Tax=Hamadaea sp. TaxID=2024425 RepID=UPI00179E253C|nr:isoprenylcysteine carboxylmethyltransferase family protein [Hamadaea sp.]NUR70414.1 isoprenylcysteine carboxylmethyltransferase family protein [Hamadaea sp.]NUT20004.1 isoprenylcysteine carboxylmethyltransferase family protein [Hamadaea sp.]